MKYVVYDKSNSNKIVEITRYVKSYKTAAAAKAAITRASKKYIATAGTEVRNGRFYEDYRIDKDPQFIYAVAEFSDYYENLETKVERTNLVTGEKFMESINTPYYCSPSSESYWSM